MLLCPGQSSQDAGLTLKIEQNKNKSFKHQRIRDPLHDLIEFDANQFEDVLWKVLQTRPFQRLRRIKQLGFSDFVYPGATHSRFLHSVGVFETARQLMAVVEEHLVRENRYLASKAHAALAAALVHDVGHGPFSHAFEVVGRRLGLPLANHEKISDMLIRNGEIAEVLKELGSGFHNDVAHVVAADGPSDIYGAVVSSQFDADRLDYMKRDRLMTGIDNSEIDFTWLISNLLVGEIEHGVDDQLVGKVETFVLGPKALYAAETYVLALFQLYPTIYFHKATRSAEKIFTELLVRVIRFGKDGSVKSTGLPSKHPIIQFAKRPDSLECILNLDDTVMWSAFIQMCDASDQTISKLAQRLRDRKLLKSVNIRERALVASGEPHNSEKLEAICQRVAGRIRIWLDDEKTEVPRLILDEAEREPYKDLKKDKGPLNQIRIVDGDKLIDLKDRSETVRAIRKFKLMRVYLDEDDTEAKDFVVSAIKEEAQ